MLNFIKNLFNKKPVSKDFLFKLELDNGDIYEEKILLENFDERVSQLLKQFHQPKDINDISFIYCLVGNIIDERFDKNLNKTVYGTKHFSPNTKVYCFPPVWGDGYEKIKVIGRHRKSNRLITMIIPSQRVTNWRLKTVYEPFVIKEMTKNFGWTDKESDKEKINEMLKWLTAK